MTATGDKVTGSQKAGGTQRDRGADMNDVGHMYQRLIFMENQTEWDSCYAQLMMLPFCVQSHI